MQCGGPKAAFSSSSGNTVDWPAILVSTAPRKFGCARAIITAAVVYNGKLLLLLCHCHTSTICPECCSRDVTRQQFPNAVFTGVHCCNSHTMLQAASNRAIWTDPDNSVSTLWKYLYTVSEESETCAGAHAADWAPGRAAGGLQEDAH